MPPLPAGFIAMTREPGCDILRDLPAALDGEAPSVAIRLNPAKHRPELQLPWATDGLVPWEPMGHYLKERPSFTLDPLLHQGLYYVQDPSSMIIGHIIRQILPTIQTSGGPLLYLDACAAPGGKTTAAIAALPEGSIVVANEFTPSRLGPLRENLARWGSPYAVATSVAVDRLAKAAPATFDIVAVDAPCSGEGMMRKDADARRQWSPGLIASCATLQREILTAAWQALRPGGFLIYSTCTFNTAENEDNLLFIARELGGHPVEIETDPSWGIDSSIKGPYSALRFIPGHIRGEGLFASLIKKPGDARRPPKMAKRIAPSAKGPDLSRLIDEPDRFSFVTRQDGQTIDLLPPLPEGILPLVKPVVTLGIVKGRDLIPDSSLAWSMALDTETFPRHEVELCDALTFLRHQAMTLPDAPKGVILLSHAGLPLGFVKNLGNRANNLHRAAWRILK
ncbi:MAG: hypothetical protein NC484_07830 [Alloprevotella sp.]|nr:hypothetical protein [Alloprevotella sp.]